MDKARVIIYRPFRLIGFAAPIRLEIDGSEIGYVKADGIFTADVNPGLRELSADSRVGSDYQKIQVQLASGTKNYFVVDNTSVGVIFGVPAAVWNIRQITETEALPLIAQAHVQEPAS